MAVAIRGIHVIRLVIVGGGFDTRWQPQSMGTPCCVRSRQQNSIAATVGEFFYCDKFTIA